ncbi:MAG: hypothetical protein AB4290_06105 [Spirulina sp.]
MVYVENPNIDRATAQVLIQNVRGQCLKAKQFSFAHEDARRYKAKSFKWLAWITLIVSIVTVLLSAFGLTTEPESGRDNTKSFVSEERVLEAEDNSDRAGNDLTRFVGILTTVAASMTTIAKLCEQNIGKPEDIASHLEVHLKLEAKIESLNYLAADIVNYVYGGTIDLDKLQAEYQKLQEEVANAIGSFSVYETDRHAFKAREAVDRSVVGRFYQQLCGEPEEVTEEIPADAPGIVATQRGMPRTINSDL